MSSEPCCCNYQLIPYFQQAANYHNIVKLTADSEGVTKLWKLNTEYPNYNTPFNYLRLNGNYFYSHKLSMPSNDLKKWNLTPSLIWSAEPDGDAIPAGAESGIFTLDLNHSWVLPDLKIYNKDGTYHSDCDDWETSPGLTKCRIAETVDDDEMIIAYTDRADAGGSNPRDFERVLITGGGGTVWYGSNGLGSFPNTDLIREMRVEDDLIFLRWVDDDLITDTQAFSIHDIEDGTELVRVSYAYSGDIVYNLSNIRSDRTGGFYCIQAPYGYVRFDSNGDELWRTTETYHSTNYCVDATGNLIFANAHRIGMIDPDGNELWHHERDAVNFPDEWMTIFGGAEIYAPGSDTYLVSGAGYLVPKYGS